MSTQTMTETPENAGLAMKGPVRFAAEIWPVLHSRPMLVLLGVLLAVDAILVLMHITHVLTDLRWIETPFSDHKFKLDTDGGFAEWFEYTKTAVCAFSLVGCWSLTQQPVYAALGVVFCLTLVDNALGLHEAWASIASGALQGTKVLFAGAPHAVGELIFFAVEGTVALVLLLLTYRRSTGRHRMLGLAFILLLLALSGFAVGVDLLHTILLEVRYSLDLIFTVIEDSGELVILSFACPLAVATYVRLQEYQAF